MIERTTDLRQWAPVLTNDAELASCRAINLEEPENRGFYRVLRLPAARFRFAIATSAQIDLNGYNLAVDSFDSADPNLSTGGGYDPAKKRDRGDIAAGGGLTNSSTQGTAFILGHLLTRSNMVTRLGPAGSIGDVTWINAGHTGIQPGALVQDLSLELAVVEAPFHSGAYTPGPGVVNGTNHSYVLGDAKYILSTLSLSGNSRMVVIGHALLYVTDHLSIGGLACIEVHPNASLRLYYAGAAATIGGNGVVNGTGIAANFVYYGLTPNTAVRLASNTPFVGGIYAPHAIVTVEAPSTNQVQFVGACVADSLQMLSSLELHYDENLSRTDSTP